MQIEKYCFKHVKGHLIVMKWTPLGSMVIPEALLITKAFDQQLKALANEISNSYTK